MKIRTIILTLVFVLLGVFLVINWNALMTDLPIDLVYTTVHAPLGAIVVAVFGAVVLLLLVYMVLQQASVTMELRAASKEARHSRGVAEDAEKSRLADMKKELFERLDNLESMIATRTDESLVNMRESIENNKQLIEGLKADVIKLNKEAQQTTSAQLASLRAEVAKDGAKSAAPAASAATVKPVATPEAAPVDDEEEKKADEKDVKEKKKIFEGLF